MACGAVAYTNSCGGAFLFDDAIILADARLENARAFLSHVLSMTRPLVKLTFLVDHHLWQTNAAGYHLLNVILHIVSALLVYSIVLRLANERSAFWTALLFVVHPIATETVTYISGRATGLMSCLYLCAILLYLQGRRYAALICFALSLLSKETAITLPLALLLVEVVVRRARVRDAVRAQAPFWGVLALFLVIAGLHTRYVELLKTSVSIRPLSEQLLMQPEVIVRALLLFVAPWRLTIDHDMRSAGPPFGWATVASIALLLAMLAIAFWLRRRNLVLSFGLLWFFLHLLPTHTVLQRYDVLSERNLYLPAVGLFLAIVSLVLSVPQRWMIRAAAVAAPLAVVAFMFATFARNALYADPVAFWTDAVAKAPRKSRPHVNLGESYFARGDMDRAITEFRTALSIDRTNPVAQSNLLKAYRRRAEMAARTRG